jgi:carboxyl-terminal processing protease
MLGELHASHLEYCTDDQFEYYFFNSIFAPDQADSAIEHIGVTGAVQGDAFVVRALFDGGPAAKAGLRVGDRIRSADGRPFSTVGAFRGRAGHSVTLTVERGGEGVRSIPVVPVKETAKEAFANATRNSVRVIRQGKRRLAYVHLWTLTHREILAAYEVPLREELGATEGLILDLRDGFGGFPERFDYVLYRPDLVLKQVTRDGKSSIERSGYGKPIVALINGGSRSAKEYLAYELKKTRRATLVGTTTAGYFLGAGYARIDDDGLLMLPKTDLLLDGKRLEGIGVAPDVMVQPRDSYGPEDAQIKRAAEVLAKKIRD